MGKLTILIGLPGCGKSTYAEKLNATVVSSDKIREEFYGDENDQTNPEKVFAEARLRIIKTINSGKDAVLDATNINKKLRMQFVNNVLSQIKKDVNVTLEAVWFAVPYEECLRRNSLRKRIVPEQVIKKMYLNFCPPGYDEGYDDIHINFAGYDTLDFQNIYSWLESANCFDQKNPHHTLSLGKHCQKCADYVKEHSDSKLLHHVALIHDCGKPFTASFLNSKGEVCDKLHFYQHHCVGAYDSAAFLYDMGYNENNIVHGANLIWWHMHPLREWRDSEKKMEKDLATLSDAFKNDLKILHEGDLLAH